MPSKHVHRFGIFLYAATLSLVCLNLMTCASIRFSQGYLGVTVKTLSPEDKEDLGASFGVVVVNVAEDGPAKKAGIREDDVIQTVNGKTIRRVEDLTRAVRNTRPGARMKIGLIRHGQKTNATVKIGRLRRVEVDYGRPDVQILVRHANVLGIRLQKLDADLSEYFKVNGNEGVLVVDVEEDGPAQQAGMRGGDVIVRIGKEKVTGPEDVPEILDAYDSGDTVNVALIRKGAPLTVTVELEKKQIRHSMQPRDVRIPQFDFRIHVDKNFRRELKRDMERLKENLEREREHLKEWKEPEELKHHRETATI